MSVDDFKGMLAVRTDKNGEAWHKMGSFVGDKTGRQAFDGFGADAPRYTKEQMHIYSDGNLTPTDFYGIVCHSGNDVTTIGTCGSDYTIVQPSTIVDAFDDKVKQPVETIGFLSDAKKMFLTWQMPRSVVVGGTDEVKMFGTLLAGFDGKVSISLSTLSFRTLCRNTFNMAMDIVKKKKSDGTSEGRIWKGRHNSANLVRDMSAWMKHVQQNAEKQVELADSLFGKLASTPVDSTNVLKSLIEQVYPDVPTIGFYPDELRGEKQLKLDEQMSKIEVDRKNVYDLFSGGDKTTKGNTAWDLFNNVTFYENHVRPSKKDTANSIVFGNRSKTMNDAFSVLVAYADIK